ncbi:carotenoid oxygenase family protein [Endozoicomonas sp.]|uniref:carotenoid oxygenase family protein n=1 Tax=Endozoicomonas sp. TaxID=1892382 RepID=UPI0028879F6C|nr:carotenoid oxygenase family protein [Endozoicomonas sp.]
MALASVTRPSLAKQLPGEYPWQALLGVSLHGEYDYQAEVEGKIPATLEGTLYRNGPGLFERNGYRKQHILDGDGMIQAIDLMDGKARYRNHFVKTPKYLREQAAGRFLYPTWTTLAPKFWENLPGIPPYSQAGVTTYLMDGVLTAHDEAGQPFALDPFSLEDLGEHTISPKGGAANLKAHAKRCGINGNWTFLGWNHGPRPSAEVIVRSANRQLINHRRVSMPRDCYIHDFFATEHYTLINLHAIEFNPIPMLAGLHSFTDCLSWNPTLGNQIVVIPRDSGQPVRFFSAPAKFMWHSFNAWEKGNEIIADFIAYNTPDHFIGKDPQMKAIMQGRCTLTYNSGMAYRYIINPGQGTLREELITDGNLEFPMIHPGLGGLKNQFGYATLGAPGQFFHSGITRIDLNSGIQDYYDFGEKIYVGEAIFVPEGMAEDKGFLLSMALNGDTGKSFLAILDAANISAGPLALVHLRHHTPFSFHGTWLNKNR